MSEVEERLVPEVSVPVVPESVAPLVDVEDEPAPAAPVPELVPPPDWAEASGMATASVPIKERYLRDFMIVW